MSDEQFPGCQTPPDWKPESGKLPVMGDESLMRPKAHGSSETPVQDPLRYGCAAIVDGCDDAGELQIKTRLIQRSFRGPELRVFLAGFAEAGAIDPIPYVS